jgi:hypothetical protein
VVTQEGGDLQILHKMEDALGGQHPARNGVGVDPSHSVSLKGEVRWTQRKYSQS